GDFGVPEEGDKGAAGLLQAAESEGGRQGPFFGFLGKNEISNGREGIFKMELEACKCCSIILDLVTVTEECDVCQMGDVRICSRTADRLCGRRKLHSTAKDPSLQFWNH
ncbi:hypothetical protein MUK42_35089, partial [Musa troglodytarum]